MDEVREFCRISQEEDWGIVGNIVPVALLGPELDGKSTRIAGTVVTA
jgi:hypothetical protein